MRRPRFTLRWLMVAVAAVGIVLGGDIMRRRRTRYLESSEFYSAVEKLRSLRARDYAERAKGFQDQGDRERAKDCRDFGAVERARALDAGIIARRYARAARYPWLPVAPGPTGRE